ncbi:TPA: hypothetical protein I2K38_000638 [Staphylococcus aureus]|nr:hypothetical protein [Staphylococcus aureus]
MKIDTTNWKSFVLKDLFSISKGQRQKSVDRISGDIPYYSASEFNNGMTDSISNPTFLKKDAVICTTFGDAFYVKGEFTASDEITILEHEKLNQYNGLFIATIIKKNKYKYSFGMKAFYKRIKEDIIKLPVDKNEEPDWKYMDSFIKKYIISLNNKYALLTTIETTDSTPLPIETWGNFQIKEIFNKVDAGFKDKKNFSRRNDISKEKNKEFSLPLTNAKHGNNGIMYYGKEKDWNSESMSIDVVANGAIAVGDVYFQPQHTSVLGDSFLIKLNKKYKRYESKNILLFLTTVLEKSIKYKFSYDHKSTWTRVKEEYIKLPVKSDMSIDWDLYGAVYKNKD